MTSDLTSAVPTMGAETGYELDEQARVPLRITGFLCLLFGLLSAAALLGRPLLLLPIVAVVFGLIALRPSGGQKPVGTMPAKVGLVLAVGFGFCGFFLPWMKTRTLGSQAAYFAQEYLELIAQDEVEMAMELRRDHVNRHLNSTPLDLYYQHNEDARVSLQRFREEDVYQAIRRAGPGADWQLVEPVRVYHEYGREKATTLWSDGGGVLRKPVYVILAYQVDAETGDGQWHVEACRIEQELLYAEPVL